MISLQEKYGEWALITGASSGIGKEFAKQLAQQKFNLVLVARREQNLKVLAQELNNAHSVQVRIVPLDLSTRDFIVSIEQATSTIDIGLLVNNAGFTITKNFTDSDIDFQQELIDVNIRAVTILTHHFANKMKKNRKGGIINVASGSAFLPIPKWSTYAASKAFVLHFTEAIWFELKPFHIDVIALCPGATKTEFNNSANLDLGMNVVDVVKSGLRNLSKRPSAIVGLRNKIPIALLRLFSRPTLIKIGARVASKY